MKKRIILAILVAGNSISVMSCTKSESYMPVVVKDTLKIHSPKIGARSLSVNPEKEQ